MGTHNGTYQFDRARHFVDDKLAAFKPGIQNAATTATNAIKHHPYIAVGIALGLGYAIAKVARS